MNLYNNHCALRKIPEQRIAHLHHGWSLKSRVWICTSAVTWATVVLP